MTGNKIDKIKNKYIEMTTARGRGHKSHDKAVEILRDMYCEDKSTILNIVNEVRVEKPKQETPKVPNAVVEALEDTLTDYMAQQKAYFDHFKRVDDAYIDISHKIEEISLYLTLIKAERGMQG